MTHTDTDIDTRASVSVRLLLELGTERGLDVDAALRAADLTGDRDPRVHPDREVRVAQEAAVLGVLAAGAGDGPVGFGWAAGRRYHLTTYGIWGFALTSSPTVAAAVDVGTRFVALSYALAQLEVDRHGDRVTLRLHADHLADDVTRTAAVARDMAAIAAVRDELVGDAVPFAAVRSRQPAPVGAADAGEDTFGVPVEHRAATDELVLPAAALARPLPRADTRTAALAEAQCVALLAERRARAGVAGEVRDRLLRDPAHPPSLAEVAAERGVTTRTLRRQLTAEGTGFRRLHDEVREALAHELLVVAGLSVEQTARRVGYLEVASFVHAFRRWTGTTPGAYRARLRKSPSGLGMRAVRDPQS